MIHFHFFFFDISILKGSRSGWYGKFVKFVGFMYKQSHINPIVTMPTAQLIPKNNSSLDLHGNPTLFIFQTTPQFSSTSRLCNQKIFKISGNSGNSSQRKWRKLIGPAIESNKGDFSTPRKSITQKLLTIC
jgi:hypothetical protein